MASEKSVGEIVQFKIVEKEKVVEIPKIVQKVVEIEVPKYVEKIYEKPVVREKIYERPIINEKDLTAGLKDFIKKEVEKALAEVMQSLKVSMEIPMSRILQVRPGGKVVDVTKVET